VCAHESSLRSQRQRPNLQHPHALFCIPEMQQRLLHALQHLDRNSMATSPPSPHHCVNTLLCHHTGTHLMSMLVFFMLGWMRVRITGRPPSSRRTTGRVTVPPCASLTVSQLQPAAAAPLCLNSVTSWNWHRSDNSSDKLNARSSQSVSTASCQNAQLSSVCAHKVLTTV
jgi:hypothetical protein